MGLKLKFYLSQALKSAKQYVYLIIGIGITVSLIIGLFTYINSVSRYNFQNSFSNIHDLEILPSNDLVNKSNFLDRFGNNESEIINLLDNSDFKIEEISHYMNFKSSSITFAENKNFLLEIYLYNPDFYDNSRFNSYFNIIEGRSPKNDSEYIIDASVAKALQLDIGYYNNLQFNVTHNSIQSKIISYSNISIVGIYLPQKSSIYFAQNNNFQSNQIYYPNFNETLLQNATYLKFPLFGVMNLQKSSENTNYLHPLNQFINKVATELNADFNESFSYTYGIAIQYRRDSINSLNMQAEITEIRDVINVFNYNYGDIYKIRLYNQILSPMSSFSEEYVGSKLSFLALIIPLIISTIGLGNLVILTNFKNRYEEFMRYRMKGYPKSMLISQIIFESLISGLFGFLIGTILSTGLFYILQPIFNPMYVSVENMTTSFIPMAFLISNYLYGLGIALVICLLGNITTIVKILRTNIREMVDDFQKLELEYGYDENIFEETKDYKKGGKNEVYLSHTDLVEHSILKVSVYLIIPSLVPFLLMLIRYIGLSPNINGIFQKIALMLSKGLTPILIFASLAPTLLTVGLIRLAIQESPLRYAKICKFLSQPFVKTYDYLAGLEMLRRKPYIIIIFILGMFTTTFIFGNMNRNTLLSEDNFYNNLNTVSDINLVVNGSSDINSYFPTEFDLNFTVLDNMVKKIENITNSNNEKIIFRETFMTLHSLYITYQNEYTTDGYGVSDVGYLCTADMESYLSYVNPELLDLYSMVENKINKLNSFNEASEDQVGILVNDVFLQYSQLEIGDKCNLLCHFNASVDPQDWKNYTFIRATIVDSLNFFPGVPDGVVHQQYYYDFKPLTGEMKLAGRYETELVIIDNSILNNYSVVPTLGIVGLFDCNDSVEFEDDKINVKVRYAVDMTFDEDLDLKMAVSFYDHSWNFQQSEVYKFDELSGLNIIFIDLTFMGILVAFAVITTIIGLENKNLHFEGLLLSRGYGKKQLFRLISSQIFTMFFISSVVGILAGSLTSWAWLQAYLGTHKFYSWTGFNIAQNIRFPVVFGFGSVFLLLFLNFGLTILLYTIFFIIQERKSITNLIMKF